MHEITLPQIKPAMEWVRGRALQKVSPQEKHARAQLRFGAALMAWADATGLGRVGSEWEFRVTPPGAATRPLVPDIAYLSYDRLPRADVDAAQIPRMAPDVAVEIISPDDRKADVDDKIRVYLASGCNCVLLVDPFAQTLEAYDARSIRRFLSSEIFTYWSLASFAIKVESIFA